MDTFPRDFDSQDYCVTVFFQPFYEVTEKRKILQTKPMLSTQIPQALEHRLAMIRHKPVVHNLTYCFVFYGGA